MLETNRQWRKNNPDKVTAYTKKAMKVWRGTPSAIHKTIRYNAKARGREYCDREVFMEWYITHSRFCAYCGIPEERLVDFGYRRLEIDRIDNDGGYFPDNMTLACRICNATKGRYLTYDEMLEIGKIIQKRWRQSAS